MVNVNTDDDFRAVGLENMAEGTAVASARRQPVAGSWDELAGVIAEFDLVPAFAPALERVLAMISTTGSSGSELVAAIESDTGLTVAVLRRAQTVRVRRPIANVPDAIAALSPAGR
jgi:phage tail tape-measure protein